MSFPASFFHSFSQQIDHHRLSTSYYLVETHTKQPNLSWVVTIGRKTFGIFSLTVRTNDQNWFTLLSQEKEAAKIKVKYIWTKIWTEWPAAYTIYCSSSCQRCWSCSFITQAFPGVGGAAATQATGRRGLWRGWGRLAGPQQWFRRWEGGTLTEASLNLHNDSWLLAWFIWMHHGKCL